MLSVRCAHKEIKSQRKKRVGYTAGNSLKHGHNLKY